MSKAVFTKHISLKNFYENYIKICEKKNIKPFPYNKYAKLLREFNSRCMEKIVYKGESFVMPNRLGTLYIKKFEVNYNPENKKNWLIDFKRTKEEGRTVYFGSPYGYKWQWVKQKCNVKGKKYYTFKPVRTSSRAIADAVNNKKLDFYN